MAFPYNHFLVIGATAGIGRAMASKLIQTGAKVTLVGRRLEINQNKPNHKNKPFRRINQPKKYSSKIIQRDPHYHPHLKNKSNMNKRVHCPPANHVMLIKQPDKETKH